MNTGATIIRMPGHTRYLELDSILKNRSNLDLVDSMLLTPRGELVGAVAQADDPVAGLKAQKTFLLLKNFAGVPAKQGIEEHELEIEQMEEIDKILEKEVMESDRLIVQGVKELGVNMWREIE